MKYDLSRNYACTHLTHASIYLMSLSGRCTLCSLYASALYTDTRGSAPLLLRQRDVFRVRRVAWL